MKFYLSLLLTSSWLIFTVNAQTVVPMTELLPEQSTGLINHLPVQAKEYLVVSANQHISQAAQTILQQGGNAIDAAVAAAIMVTLVEPQSAGIGGGAFLLYFNQAQKILTSIDARETAAALAKPNRFLNAQGLPLSYPDAVNNGQSIGVPALLRGLELAHQRYGKLPWKELFTPTIELAQSGFAISPRLHQLVLKDPFLKYNAAALHYFYLPHQDPPQVKPVGTILKNPELANTLMLVASQGANVFYESPLAQAVINAVQQHPRPGDLSLNDLKNYQAIEREVVCGPYRRWKICGMGPPSSGGITLLQILGLLERFNWQNNQLTTVDTIHLFAEAGSLAYADRDRYIADPKFIAVPIKELLNPIYLQQRSQLIDQQQSMGIAKPGNFPGFAQFLGDDSQSELPATSHFSIVDQQGNAVSLTMSVAAAFGTRIMVKGFFLNNELTDFSFLPDQDGRPIANQVGPNKRPRSSMSPTLVFDEKEKLRMVIGSAGGPAIINFVAKAVMGVLDWNLDLQQAVRLPNMGSRNAQTELEKNSVLEKYIPDLKARGHNVKLLDLNSGTHGIWVDANGLWSGIDTRREGVALGK